MQVFPHCLRAAQSTPTISAPADICLKGYAMFCSKWQESETAHNTRNFGGHTSVRPVSFDRIMLWAALCLAFFAFLRVGEFTCPSLANFDESVMLAVGDVAVDSRTQPSYILVQLKRSKNDPFGQRVILYVGRSHKKLCAVSAVLSYLAIRSPAPGPFIVFEDGGVLSRQRLVTELSTALLEVGLDPSPYKGHRLPYWSSHCSG